MKRWGVVALTMAVVGCGGTERSLTLRVETPLEEGPAGSIFQLNASVEGRSGERVMLGDLVQWDVSDPEVAAMRDGQQLTLLRAGTVTVTAHYRGEVATAIVRVRAADAKTLQLLPDVDALHVDDVQAFVLSATFGDGNVRDATQTAHWTFEGALAPAGMPGKARAVREGLGVVRVELGGQVLERKMLVLPTARVALQLLVPPSARAGEDAKVALVATYADGTMKDVSVAAMWTTSNPDVAELITGGSGVTLRPLRAGFAQVSAFSDGVKRTVAVSVTGVALASLDAEVERVEVAVGATAQLAVFATALDGTRTDVTASATWDSANPAVFEVDVFGRVTAVAEGTSHVRISYGGKAAAVEVVVQPARLAAVVPSVQGLRLGVGQAVAVVLTGRYTDGRTVDLTSAAVPFVNGAATAKLTSAWVLTGTAPGAATVLFTAAGFEVPVALEVSKTSYDALTLSVVRNDQAVRVVATARWSDGVESDVTELTQFAIKGPAGAVSNAPGSHGVLSLPNQGEVWVVGSVAQVSAQVSVAAHP